MWITDPITREETNRQIFYITNPNKLWIGDIIEFKTTQFKLMKKQWLINNDGNLYLTLHLTSAMYNEQLPADHLPGIVTVFRRRH